MIEAERAAKLGKKGGKKKKGKGKKGKKGKGKGKGKKKKDPTVGWRINDFFIVFIPHWTSTVILEQH